MIKNIKYIAIDFDGVLTDNKLVIDERGIESVICNRSDGLAINVLKKLGYLLFIISSEKNTVVVQRGKKMGIQVYHGIDDKSLKLYNLSKSKKITLSKTLYIGNDLNDYKAMKLCAYSCCPKDAHSFIKKNCTKVLKTKGGDGVMREIVEIILKRNFNKMINLI